MPPWRGLGPGPFELSNAQYELGHNITVITKYYKDCEAFDMKIPYQIIRIKSRFDLIFSFKAMILYFYLRNKKQFDIIHNHGFSALWLILIKKIFDLKTPLVSSVHIVRMAQFFNVKKVDFLDLSWKKIMSFVKNLKNLK